MKAQGQGKDESHKKRLKHGKKQYHDIDASQKTLGDSTNMLDLG